MDYVTKTEFMRLARRVTELAAANTGDQNLSSYVTGPASATAGNIATLDATGKILSDGGKAAASLVTGPAANTADKVPLWDGANSKALKDGKALSGADDKIITGTPGTSGNVPQWDANGDIIDGAIAVAAVFDKNGTIYSIGDNSVIYFYKNSIGVLIVIPRNVAYKTVWGTFVYRALSTNVFMEQMGGSSIMAVTTGALNGTTGTDGKVTVSAHTDGYVYIENRFGSAISINAITMGS
jgi:hypothetical protein